MIKNYKKGDVVDLTYLLSDIAKNTERVIGIIYKISDDEFTLAHNFIGSKPIDITTVRRESILKCQKIIPKEINSLSSLRN